jgi:hypothetical protein
MSQANRPSGTQRKPGRSFDDPSRPMGEKLIQQVPENSSAPEGGVYGRATEYGPRPVSVADRAKAVSVLRKSEEFMRTHNPPATTPEGMRRALELAAGRVGLTIEEYDEIVKHDPEMKELERQVLEDMGRRERAGITD